MNMGNENANCKGQFRKIQETAQRRKTLQVTTIREIFGRQIYQAEGIYGIKR